MHLRYGKQAATTGAAVRNAGNVSHVQYVFERLVEQTYWRFGRKIGPPTSISCCWFEVSVYADHRLHRNL